MFARQGLLLQNQRRIIKLCRNGYPFNIQRLPEYVAEIIWSCELQSCHGHEAVKLGMRKESQKTSEAPASAEFSLRGPREVFHPESIIYYDYLLPSTTTLAATAVDGRARIRLPLAMTRKRFHGLKKVVSLVPQCVPGPPRQVPDNLHRKSARHGTNTISITSPG